MEETSHSPTAVVYDDTHYGRQALWNKSTRLTQVLSIWPENWAAGRVETFN